MLFKNVTEKSEFSSLELWYVGVGLVFCFRIRQEILNIAFCIIEFYGYKRVLFRDRFENVLIHFLFHLYCYSDFCFVLVYQGLLNQNFLQLVMWHMCLERTERMVACVLVVGSQ